MGTIASTLQAVVKPLEWPVLFWKLLCAWYIRSALYAVVSPSFWNQLWEFRHSHIYRPHFSQTSWSTLRIPEFISSNRTSGTKWAFTPCYQILTAKRLTLFWSRWGFSIRCRAPGGPQRQKVKWAGGLTVGPREKPLCLRSRLQLHPCLEIFWKWIWVERGARLNIALWDS